MTPEAEQLYILSSLLGSVYLFVSIRKLGIFVHGHGSKREALMLCSCHCMRMLYAGKLIYASIIYIRNPLV
jgi:hypothetical protein